MRSGLVMLTWSLILLVAACGSSPATMNPAVARKQISEQYGILFDFANSNVSVKIATIQDGSSLREALSQALSSQLAKAATGARVDGVQLLGSSTCAQEALPSPCAEVTYDLLGTNGQPLFTTPSSGYAVFVSGKWLVAKATICGLLGLFYSESGRTGTPPGCT